MARDSKTPSRATEPLRPEIGGQNETSQEPNGLYNLLKRQGETAVFILLLLVITVTGHRFGVPEKMLEFQFYSCLGVYFVLRLVELFRGAKR